MQFGSLHYEFMPQIEAYYLKGNSLQNRILHASGGINHENHIRKH